MKYYKGDWKYRLAEQLVYYTGITSDGAALPFCSIEPDGRLIIERGYSWDGASKFPDFKSIMRGACIHDALYQLLRETPFGKEDHDARRLEADLILWRVCVDDGMSPLLARMVKRGVRVGGGPAAATKKRKVYEVSRRS